MNLPSDSKPEGKSLWWTAAVAIALGGLSPAVGLPPSWAGAFGLLACHVPVLLGAWCVSGCLTGRPAGRPTSSRDLVLTGQIYFTSLMALGLILGSTGLLNRTAALVFSAALGLAMMWYGRRHAAPPFDRIGVHPGALWHRRLAGTNTGQRPEPQVDFGCTPSRSLVERLSHGALLVVIGFVVWSALAEPSYEYDTLTYHLFFPARWIQDGAISIVPTWFGDPAPAYAPSATEVYYAWLMLPMGGDAVARGGQFPFWILLVCAVHALARELRLRPSARAVVSLFAAIIPAVAAQALTAMVDVAFAAHLVVLTLFALRVGRTRAAPDMIGLVLAAGLLLGTKFIAIAYLLGMSPLLAWTLWQMLHQGSRRSTRAPGLGQGVAPITSHAPRTPTPGILPALILSLLAAAWVGGFWYARNSLATGNPLYPLEVKLGDRVLLGGAYGREQMENSPFNVRRRNDPDAFDRAIWEALHWPVTPFPPPDETGRVPAFRDWYLGPAGLIAVLFLVSATWTTWRWTRTLAVGSRLNVRAAAAMESRRPYRVPGLLLHLCAAATFAIFWFVLPFQQPRFAWGPIILAIVAGAAMVRYTRRWVIILPLLVFVVWWISFSNDCPAWSGGHNLPIFIILLMVLVWSAVPRPSRLVNSLPAWLTALVFLAVVIAPHAADDPRNRTMSRPNWRMLGEAWSWVDRNLHDVNIAYAGNNVPYFLCGRHLENRVCYVPARRPAGGRFHDFAALPQTRTLGPSNTSEPACDRYVMDPEAWLQNLRDLRVDYVFVSALFPNLLPNYRHDAEGFPIEREWLDALCQVAPSATPMAQCRVFAPGSARLYKLNFDAPPPPGLQLRSVTQDETDALHRLRQDRTPPGQPIRDYPLARPMVEKAGSPPS